MMRASVILRCYHWVNLDVGEAKKVFVVVVVFFFKKDLFIMNRALCSGTWCHWGMNLGPWGIRHVNSVL